MTTRITHVNTKLADDPTDSAKLISVWVRERKNLRSPPSNHVTFAFTSEGLKCFLLKPGINVPSLVQIQKGVMDFEKNIH